MTRALRFYALLALVMGGQVAALVVDRSSWPYSTFAMFSYTPEGRTLRSFVLVGMAGDGSEISLEPCLRPLTPLQVDQGIDAAIRRSEVREVLRETFERCTPGQPSLVRVRVDDTTWQLDAHRPSPPRRTEVASYP